MNERTVLQPRRVKLENLGLSATEAFVFTQIDGSAPLGDVADMTGVPLETVIAIARRLGELGVVDGVPGLDPKPSVSQKAASPAVRPEQLRLVPRRTGRDVYGMKIEPREAFLLSYVDNQLSIAELAEILGYEPGKATESVEALVAAGALELGPAAPRAPVKTSRRFLDAEVAAVGLGPSAGSYGGSPSAGSYTGAYGRRPEEQIERVTRPSKRPKAVAPPAAAPRRSSLRPPKPAPKVSSRPPAREASAPPQKPVSVVVPVAAPALEPPCDLDPESVAKIDAALLATAAGQTHYAIVGVARTASNKELRRAYFALAATLHPDRYFRKNLGPYKRKLDEAFQRVTDSYELLRVESRRAEYEATLPPLAAAEPTPPGKDAASGGPSGGKRRSVRGSKAFKKPSSARMPVAPVASDAAVVRVRSERSEGARRPSKALKKPSSARIAASVPSAQPASGPTRAAASVPPAPPASGSARAAVKSRSIPPASAPASAPRVPTSPPASEIPKSGIVDRAKTASAAASPPAAEAAVPRSSPPATAKAPSKSERLLEDAQKALIAGDATAAANAYRLALQLAEDSASRRYAESGLNEARSMLADAHVKSARLAEKDARWSVAVVAYGKALDLRANDPALCERLANALREEGQDLARATEIAELAVSRAPRRASFRKTLGRIHAEAGLRAKALEQLEGAFALEPDEDTGRLIAVLRK